eukprot:1686734-Amphidinium_carterae.1
METIIPNNANLQHLLIIQCNGNAIFAGRTYPVVKVIQQLMVTKTNVCSQHHAGCVAASINHLGIYALMIPIESLGRAVAATHDLNWVDELQNQD